MDETLSKKKTIAVIALAALIVIALALYWFLHTRTAAPPPTVAPPGVGVMPPISSRETKMRILQNLPTETVSAARRKSILQALMAK